MVLLLLLLVVALVLVPRVRAIHARVLLLGRPLLRVPQTLYFVVDVLDRARHIL